MKYTPVIGLEVHVELKTKSKMFCRCSADYFGKEPNTHTCPVCLGLPGALPFPNPKAIVSCIKIGIALNCVIPLYSKFDRKNYFYPDLPKGYQISQYDNPFAVEGWMDLSSGKRIKIRRVHMEEDTGKLIHEGDYSLIDFNRSGVPLVEIVTEPDFETPEEVNEYLQKLQQIVRYLDVSDANMERGDMRLEPNISLRPEGKIELPGYKVEVKNINSFKFVDRAINYEIKRQEELLEKAQTPLQETRGFVDKNMTTVSQRLKEEASDYRYFPEPDISSFVWNKDYVLHVAESIPEMPNKKMDRFEKEYSLTPYQSEILTRDRETADFFEQAVLDGKKGDLLPKEIANYLINKKIDTGKILPAELINQMKQNKPVEIDEKALNLAIDKVLKAQPQAVEDYKKGRENAIMFLVGHVMREFKTRIDADQVKASLLAKIK